MRLLRLLQIIFFSAGCDIASDNAVPASGADAAGIDAGADAGRDSGRPPDHCAVHADCPPDYLCSGGKCVLKPECIGPADCGEGNICVEGKCAPLPGCSDDSDCPAGETCGIGGCGPARECADRSDCMAGELCIDGRCGRIPGCEEGGACPAGTACRQGYCLPGECSSDEDCPAGMRCGPQAACVECAADSDCGPGLFCKPETGRCASRTFCETDEDCPQGRICIENHMCVAPPNCASDADCPLGRTCDPQAGVCVAGCADDSRCPAGTFCSSESGRCIEGCDDDSRCLPGQYCDVEAFECREFACEHDFYEPNDEPAEAEELSAAGLTYPELTLCGPDEWADWYRIIIEPGSLLDVTIAFSQPRGDLDLYLFRGESLELVDRSAGQTGAEAVQTGSLEGGLFFIEVESPNRSSTGYSMTVRVTAAGCELDPFEPNDEPDAASRVTAGGYEGLTVCGADADYFKIAVPADKTISASVEASGLLEGLRLEILSPDASQALAVDRFSDADQDSTLTAAAVVRQDGDYLMKVSGAAATFAGYGLLVEITDSCGQDALEPSNSAEQPAALQPVNATYGNLAVCGEDEDWYGITVPEATLLKVDLSFSNASGDLDMELFHSSDPGNPLRISQGQGDSEHVELDARTGGSFLIRVYLYQEANPQTVQNVYSMTVTLAPGSSCQDDRFETGGGNDTAQTASAGEMGEIGGLTLCGPDQDWFKARVASGGWLTATAAPSWDAGVADGAEIRIVGIDGETALARTPLLDRPARVFIQASEEGDYFAVVAGGATTDMIYNLSLSDAEPCGLDEFEPNDNRSAAASLHSGTFELALCRQDTEDWFSFGLGAGGTVDLRASFASAEGDIDMRLYDSSFEVVGSSEGMNDTEEIAFTAVRPDVFLLKVFIYQNTIYAEEVPYELEVSGLCEDDAFEPNDAREAATWAAAGAYENLMICRNDDWYRIELDSRKTARVSLSFANAEGDIDMRLFGEGGDVPLASSETKGDGEVIEVELDAGVYFIAVFIGAGYIDRENGYAMQIEME